MIRILAITALLGASLVGNKAPLNRPAGPTCVSDNGTNVNAYFGLRHASAIWLNLQGRQPPCLTVVKGTTMYRTHGWFTQQAPAVAQPVYPDGYRPDFPAPMTDFLSKITQARYVISRDGQTEITRTVTRRDLLRRAKLGTFGDLFGAPDTTLVPGVTIHGPSPEWTTLEPFGTHRLNLGQHTIDIYWTLTKQHCDGFAPDLVNNCLPAGETITTSTRFTVVARP
jgi:hypothetical protein